MVTFQLLFVGMTPHFLYFLLAFLQMVYSLIEQGVCEVLSQWFSSLSLIYLFFWFQY